MKYKLAELIDIPKLQSLLDSLDAVYGLPSAIIDIEGNILTATAWQDICTGFHRTNPAAEKLCRESDARIFRELESLPPHVIYKCPHGLVDTITPIVVEGNHYGSAFTGQLFIEPPDEDQFRRQAREYGFDETAYIEALRRVPVISEDRLKQNLKVLSGLTVMLAEQGLRQKRLIETEARLKESETTLGAIFHNSNDGIIVADKDSRRFIVANNTVCDMLGYTAAEMLSLTVESIHPADSLPYILEQFGRQVRGEISLADSLPVLRKDGSVFFADVSAFLITLSDRECLVGMFRDITEKKAVTDKINRSLLEKDMLLREVHHRVKNNMAVISSLLSLQSRYVDDEKYLNMFRESQGRIKSMSLAHDKLYQNDNLLQVDIKNYVVSLLRNVRNTFTVAPHLKMHIDVENVRLDIDTLIPCGLIINELLTNSFKYAFSGHDSPEISISLKSGGTGYAVLTVGDNGAGLPEGFDVSIPPGLGLQLVNTLCQQINGRIEVTQGGGAVFTLTFPEKINLARLDQAV